MSPKKTQRPIFYRSVLEAPLLRYRYQFIDMQIESFRCKQTFRMQYILVEHFHTYSDKYFRESVSSNNQQVKKKKGNTLLYFKPKMHTKHLFLFGANRKVVLHCSSLKHTLCLVLH